MQVDAHRGDEEAQSKAQAGREHGTARPAVLHPAPEHRRRGAQERNGDGKNPGDVGEFPVDRGPTG